MIDEEDLFDGIVGGGELSPDRIQTNLQIPSGLDLENPVDRQIGRLIALHPTAVPKFRNNSIASLNDAAKKDLLQDIQDALGIVPLRNE